MKAQPSYTLEIHQVEGRLPLRDAQPMFAHWVDLTNAERVNYWLSVLSENHALAVELAALCGDGRPPARRRSWSRLIRVGFSTALADLG